MTPEESSPAFKVTKNTLVKTPLSLIFVVIGFAIAATIAAVNLSRDVADLRRDLGEAQRVNAAQDKRLDFADADLRRLERSRKFQE